MATAASVRASADFLVRQVDEASEVVLGRWVQTWVSGFGFRVRV